MENILEFIPDQKYVLTRTLGDDSWLQKNSILTAVYRDDGLRFTNPTLVFSGVDYITIDNTSDFITLDDYYIEHKYSNIEHSIVKKFSVGKNLIEVNLSYATRAEDSTAVLYNYFVTENSFIKLTDSGYSHLGKIPTITEILLKYKNN